LNTDSDEAVVTSLGRTFHTFAPATGKARPLIVDRRQVGTSSCSVEADMSLRRCGMSATRVKLLSSSMKAMISVELVSPVDGHRTELETQLPRIAGVLRKLRQIPATLAPPESHTQADAVSGVFHIE